MDLYALIEYGKEQKNNIRLVEVVILKNVNRNSFINANYDNKK